MNECEAPNTFPWSIPKLTLTFHQYALFQYDTYKHIIHTCIPPNETPKVAGDGARQHLLVYHHRIAFWVWPHYFYEPVPAPPFPFAVWRLRQLVDWQFLVVVIVLDACDLRDYHYHDYHCWRFGWWWWWWSPLDCWWNSVHREYTQWNSERHSS
jgi:hypothetical protein